MPKTREVCYVPYREESLEDLSRPELLAFVRNLLRENRKLSRDFNRLRDQIQKSEYVNIFEHTIDAIQTTEQRKLEKYMTLLLSNSRNIFFFLDKDSRFIYCTDFFLNLLNIDSFEQINGRTLSDVYDRFMPETFADDIIQAFEDCAAKFTPVMTEARMSILTDQEWEDRSYTVMLTPIPDQLGAFGGVIMLYHDITDLEARIWAEDANIAKDEFLANVSHEIRTPLNAILGLSELALQRSLEDDTREALEKIYAAGLVLLGLINDVLDVSKIQAGKFELIPDSYDFAEMLSETVSLNVVRIGSKPILFNLETDENIPSRLYGDDTRVKQILNNLLSNAFKFTEKGSVTLSVSGKIDDKGNILMTYTVRDTGKGIRQGNLAHLFKNYSRFDPQSNRNIEGAGLGLSICKSLSEMMGGAINVDSEYGVGSAFTVTLRQGVLDVTPIGAETVRKLKEFRLIRDFRSEMYIARVSMPGAKVLVVDDVVTNLDVAKGLLLRYDLTVHCVHSGSAALQRIRDDDEPYDLIFMDHMMPDMDGLETVWAIRHEIDRDYARTVPIIMLTANAVSGRREMFLQHEVNDFLAKPIDILQLDNALRAWIPQEKQFDRPESELALADRSGKKDMAVFSIPGVDTTAGLMNAGGSVDLYTDVLSSFCRDADKKSEELRQCCESGDLPLYTILVHGLKGAARGIGADGFASFAEKMENFGKAENLSEIQKGTSLLLTDLRTLTGRIRALLSAITPDVPDTDGEALPIPDIDTLRNALMDMDIETINRMLTSYAHMPFGEETKQHISEIEQHVLLFEYDEAVRVIDEMTV